MKLFIAITLIVIVLAFVIFVVVGIKHLNERLEEAEFKINNINIISKQEEHSIRNNIKEKGGRR